MWHHNLPKSYSSMWTSICLITRFPTDKKNKCEISVWSRRRNLFLISSRTNILRSTMEYSGFFAAARDSQDSDGWRYLNSYLHVEACRERKHIRTPTTQLPALISVPNWHASHRCFLFSLFMILCLCNDDTSCLHTSACRSICRSNRIVHRSMWAIFLFWFSKDDCDFFWVGHLQRAWLPFPVSYIIMIRSSSGVIPSRKYLGESQFVICPRSVGQTHAYHRCCGLCLR